jgi:putative DNA primase/helicase
VLRFHPRLPYYGEPEARPTRHPALVAAIQAPDGRIISIHRVYLDNEGHKANVDTVKKFMKATTGLKGAAIRLDAAGPELVVTEGIETAMAVRLTAGMPAWAALSATGVSTLWVPQTTRLLVIAADHDVNGKGVDAARILAHRLLKEDPTKTVKILEPTTPGRDWADSLGKACYYG